MCIVHAMNFQRIVCVLPEYQHHFTPDDDVGMLAPHWNDMPYFKYIFKPLTNEHWFLSISHTIFLFLFLSLCINWNCKLLMWTTLLSLYSRWCQLIPIAILMCVCVCVYTRWQKIMQHEQNYMALNFRNDDDFLIYFYANWEYFQLVERFFLSMVCSLFTRKKKKTLSILLAQYSSIFL